METTKQIICALLITIGTTAADGASLSVTITDDNGETLADAVVYLEADNINEHLNDAELNIEQVNKTFRPFVSAAQVGTRAYFPNRDGIGHHVYSFSPAKIFQLPLSEEISTDSILLDKTGVVTVGCNIHDWMVGYIYVVETSLNGVSDEKGLVEIQDIPTGNYQLHVWHPGLKGDEISKPISIAEGDTSHSFSLALKPEYFWKPAVEDEDEY